MADAFPGVEGEFDSGRFERALGVLIKPEDRYPEPGTALFLNPPSTEVVDAVRFPIERILRNGAWAEDNPNPRSAHHFHDPAKIHDFAHWGRGLVDRNRAVPILDVLAAATVGCLRDANSFSCLFDLLPGQHAMGAVATPFALTGVSARERALNGPTFGPLTASEEYPRNLFALPGAERYLYAAFTAETEREREHAMALHFLALGHVLHLIQDMTSPAHTRNDFQIEHVLKDNRFSGLLSFDSVGRETPALDLIAALSRSASLLTSLPRAFIESAGFDPSAYAPTLPNFDPHGREVGDYWDNLQNESDGLAEVVNRNFFSLGSISNDAAGDGYASPTADTSCSAGKRLPIRPEDPQANGSTSVFLTSSLVPHLAHCRFHATAIDFALLNGANPHEELGAFWLKIDDESVRRDYLEILFALTIDYTEKFLRSYLSPRIQVVQTGPGKFSLRNLSSLPFTANSDAVEIAYTAADPAAPEGRRVLVAASCGANSLVLPPKPAVGAAPLGAFDCTLPTSLPEPASRMDFWVIIRGQLGERGEAGTPSEFDAEIEPRDFVVAFDHVQPEILFQSAGPLSPGETDEATQSDLIAVPADLTRSVASAKESPTLRNLGLELRPALAQRFNLTSAQLDRLDFISPSAEPGGARIALALDLAQAQGSVTESPNDIWILDLTKSPEDQAALTMVPKTPPRLGTPGPRWVAWNRDGVNDNLVFGAFDPGPAASYLVRHELTTGESSPRETLHVPGSLHGAVLAGIPIDGIGAFDVSDIHLVDVGTGIGTHRFNLGTLGVEPCGETGCSIGGGGVSTQDEEPEFSPDGTQVAFISAPVQEALYTGGKLYVADLIRSGDAISGGSLRRIGTMERAMSPIWSPDGAWIVYSDNVVHDLFAVPAAGGDAIRLTYTGTLTAGNLTWLSPLTLPTNP